MNSHNFNAPWGKTLRWMSVFSVVILTGVSVPLFFLVHPAGARLAVLAPLLLLPVAALFVVRSYTLEPNVLVIQRLLWATRLPLAGLQSAEAVPGVMRGSLRWFGNGGLLSITGWYRNRALGNYRAFVTDLTRTVVLRFPAKTVVVSPENPARFVAEISPFAFRTSQLSFGHDPSLS